jgi:teichuronic acid biosynthesis glycosyltransferase TuaG
MLHEFLENIIEIIAMRNEKVVVFDWNAYIHLYRDIANAGFVSRKQVIWHMIHHGQYNKRLLLDTDGNNYYHVFNKNEYETIIYKNFETEEDAYIHFCDNHNDVSLICTKLFIKKKYIESYKGTVLLDKITRIVMKYNNINELYHSEEKNTSFSELCVQIYNDHHKIDTKSVLDSNIISSNSITMEENCINNNCKMKMFSINDFKCINVENKHDYEHLISTTNGDTINETNFVKHIAQENITLYYNNKFISGNKDLLPEITISRNVKYSDVINKKNLFLSNIPYNNASNGLYFITQSMIDAVKDKNSLLYPHVYDHSLINEIIKKPAFLHEQFVDKSWYNWATDDEITELKLKHFPKDAFVICICGRIAINSYPKSLLEAIKVLREQGYNIHLLALTKFEVSPHRLTQNLYDEIISYDWVKSITVDKKDVLNYYRMCDVLTSTYRDYCNHIGGSNKIKEYLLCDKPILCSRGKERENELGKDYPGFYDCETCDTVPPLCWTQEFIKNPGCYIKQYETYFKNVDINLCTEEINQIFDYISKYTKIVDLKCLITKLSLTNIVVCPGLKAFSRIKDCYDLTSEYDINKPTIFFGLYSIDDVNTINNHKGLKYIMFGGNDCNLNSKHRIDMIEAIDFNKNVSFISISNDMYNRLVTLRKKYKLSNIIYKSNLNLLDPNIWKEINILENFVYVYDGCMKKTEVYSSDICDNIIDILTKKYKTKMNFIRTSDFKSFISQEELFKIYNKCFIGMRLTYHDGNANTVQEFERCKLPIIHNQSDYGINWENENDIVQTIENEYKKHLVSVIIPTFNRMDLLKETVNAILKQTYQIFEILIINDCSKDYNFETYKQLEDLDDRITVYNLENNLGAAGLVRNYGIEKSNGTYIAFCDDDDLWIENKLEKQLLSLKNTNFDMCSTNAYKLENGIKTDTKLMPDFNKYPEELTFDFLTGVYPKGNIICTSSVLLKKSILKFKFSSKKYSEDYGQWLSILNDGKNIYFLNEPLLHYRIDGNNKQSDEKSQKLKILIYQGINAYRCYKYTKLLSQMGYIVDCCYSYQDFSFHHGKDVLDTKHINKLFKINNYDEYLKISKDYDILFCVDIIDATPGNIQVGYQNFKNNIKTIHLIGDLFILQKPPEHNYYKMEYEILNNINPSLIIFSGKFLKQSIVDMISNIKHSSVILNTPLTEHIKINKINNNTDKIRLIFSTNFTSINQKHHRNLNEVFKLLTQDKRIEIFVYYTKNSEIYIKEYTKQPNIHFMGTIDLDKMIYKFSEYDIGVIYFEDIYEDKNYINLSEPNKMYEYYFAQLPIICNNSLSFNENIVQTNIGISLDLRNEQNLYSNLYNLIKSYNFTKNVYPSFDDDKNQAIIKTLLHKY